jgi:hypothetical protein
MAGRGEHGVDRLPIEPSGLDLDPERVGGCSRRQRRSIRSGLTLPRVHVGDSEDPRARRQRNAVKPMGITRSIQTLPVQCGQSADPMQRGGPGQYPFGEVGVEANSLELGPRQRSRVVPDGVRNAEAAKIVQETGPLQ